MQLLSKFFIAILAISLVISCKNQPEGEAAKTGDAADNVATAPADAAKYAVKEGKVYWGATKVGGAHNGTINISKGVLTAANGKVTSGDFGIDINSIDEPNMEGEMKTKLLNHLKSPDFFDAANHSAGMFSVVSVEPLSGNPEATHTVTGNLTLKGITKSVSFPANIVVTDSKISAVSPKFTINRMDWDIKYNSGLIGTAKDKIIHDDVSLSVELLAEAQ